ENAALARSLGAGFLQKGSPEILRQLRNYLTEHLFFGDFVFRLPDGSEIDRASDLRTLVERLRRVPPESVAFHASRNDFSRWLRARAEFGVASKLRPKKISDFSSVEGLRAELIASIDGYRRERNRSTVAPFSRETFDPDEAITQIGTGSLGGKGRGLAFAARLLDEVKMDQRFEGVRISVPPAVILGTGVFEAFMESSDLRSRAIQSEDDEETRRRILVAPFPHETTIQLAAFLEQARYPLAVRSSSLLEDSPHQPFAGIYDTCILANDHADLEVRLDQLIRAVKEVYASTFTGKSKAFLRATTYRLEEEQMAVILQRVVGRRRNGHYYPDLAGVARSHNYYPVPPARTEDGIAAVALGLGRTVAQGEPCLRFSPAYPRHMPEVSTVEDMVDHSQRNFWAVRMGEPPTEEQWRNGGGVVRLPLDVAEEDGALELLGSTYSPENNAVYDGIGRDGIRLVSFAPILKHGAFPLAEILQELLIVGRAGTRLPVEIEFAANLDTAPGEPAEFAFLQLRPLAVSREEEAVEIDEEDPAALVCDSPSVLGHGRVDGIRDLVVVDRNRFDRARSRDCAEAVGRFNAALSREERPYLLVGVGRWGSTQPWLDIP
ncbi:MAG TPA: PEP/pyruvate-binding domain-containing protein, partial [Longimicrobiales bacterium]|nr:PEP/pyruvate-binding domain-containing protein [Longimicrobiales bacterium]